jgi:preprotein translocase subunit SecE
VQAPQLPELEVEAEHARPRRAEEVLPLVRAPHGAQGDALVARNTRQKRRQRRRAQGGAAAEQTEDKSVTQRARARQQAVRPSAQPPKTQTGSRRVPGGGFKRFVSESWAELKKVEWPTQNQVVQGTIVVIIACAIVGGYLWLADLIFKPLVRDILLR